MEKSNSSTWAIGMQNIPIKNIKTKSEAMRMDKFMEIVYCCSFGILPTMEKLYHRGVMRTKCDDCQFVCITQTDYYRIQHQGEENTRRHEENGRLVMVTEQRGHIEVPSRRGHIVIRVTKRFVECQIPIVQDFV